jgi:hypothetical protein
MKRNIVELNIAVEDNLQSIVSYKLIDSDISDNSKNIIFELMRFRLEKRLWLINTKEALSDLWAEIRKNGDFCDFLMDVTMSLRSKFTSLEWKDLALQYSEAYTCCGVIYNDEQNVIDEDMFNRLPDTSDFNSFLYCNPWFLTLLLINQTYFDFLNEVKELLEKEEKG